MFMSEISVDHTELLEMPQCKKWQRREQGTDNTSAGDVRAYDKNVGIIFFRYLSLLRPITPSPSCLPLEGGETLCFRALLDEDAPCFPSPSGGGQGGGGVINCAYQ